MIAGAVSFVLFVFFGIVAAFDSTPVLGVNRWIKPMKFFISIAIFLWTLAVYLNYVKGFDRSAKMIAYGSIGVMIIEMTIIVMQAARGTTSHFNSATAFDTAMFAVMGLAIVGNTLLVAWLLYLYFRAGIDLPRAMIWGMRLGILIFLLGSIEGGYMAQHMAHTVGASDGGPGLPVVNWSTIAGDLRIAHFFGLHSFQAIPIFAYMLNRFRFASPMIGTAAFAFLYFAAFTLLFVQALLGRPFIAI